jgi:hypothetical protein
MTIIQTLKKIDKLAAKEDTIERIELQRRENLIKRLNTSRYNNLKLFSLKIKGDTNCSPTNISS